MMKETSDEESLLKWLRTKQERFGSIKNASFELLSEHPNKTINVCLDGPKILVLPNVSEILYCYTRDQWIEKLWSDLHLSAFHYPIIVLNILIFLFGTTGNIFVCLSVYKNHQLRNVTNYFIVNLAFADFLVILICLPATVIWDLSLTWFFGTIPCKLVMFLQDVSISVSVLTLTAISIDRYYAVCYPLKFKSSLNQATKIIVLIWIVSLILMAPDLIYLSAKMSPELSEANLDTVLYSDCNYDWTERSSRTFQFVKTILLYLLPLILMLCAHFKIMQTLQQASKTANYRLEQVISTPADTAKRDRRNDETSSAGTFNEEVPSPAWSRPVSSFDRFNLGAAEQQQQQQVASSAPANTTSLNANNPSTGQSEKAGVAQSRSGETSRNLRQIRFVDSCTGSGQSDGTASRQSTTTTTTTTVNSLPASIATLSVATATDEAAGKAPTDSIDPSATETHYGVASGSRRLSRSFNEVLSKFKSGRAGRSSFAERSTSINSASDWSPTAERIGKQRQDPQKNGSICSTNNQFEMNSRASLSNPNQLIMLTIHNKNKLESRRMAAKMLMTIVVMFGICYLPVHLINFLRQFIEDIPQTDVTSTISMLSHCVCYLNSAINPIIYNHMNSVFREEFRKFFSCLRWNRAEKKEIGQKSAATLSETQSTRCALPRRPSNYNY